MWGWDGRSWEGIKRKQMLYRPNRETRERVDRLASRLKVGRAKTKEKPYWRNDRLCWSIEQFDEG